MDNLRRQALEELARSFPDEELVLIGATALAKHISRQARATLDIDLCVPLSPEVIAARAPSSWERSAVVQHRWCSADGVLIDVLPVTGEGIAAGFVRWADGSEMNLAGLDLAADDHEPMGSGFPTGLRVASLRSLFVSKVAAWRDRPADRLRDLRDIAVILRGYPGDDDGRLFEDPRIDQEREFDERSPFLLGVDLEEIVEEVHRELIQAFTKECMSTATGSLLIDAAPVVWSPEDLGRILGALEAGLRS